MSFTLPDHWVWDFWFADDGETFHMYYLRAPKSLGDEHLRHRNARIGHATSPDLVDWTDHGIVLQPGGTDGFDASATWTGSVVRDPAGGWRMFYTGTRFVNETAHTNIESVGAARSDDLHTWTKTGSPVAVLDERIYESLADGTWHEEAWRDPWVYPIDGGWRMLIAARARQGDRPDRDRGVVAVAESDDLDSWTVRPPLDGPGLGFAHLEVPQLITIDSAQMLLFSCDSAHLAGSREEAGETGGIWSAELLSDGRGATRLSEPTLLLDERLYSGRVIRDRAGEWQLLAFVNQDAEGRFAGRITDPMPVTMNNGTLSVLVKETTP